MDDVTKAKIAELQDELGPLERAAKAAHEDWAQAQAKVDEVNAQIAALQAAE